MNTALELNSQAMKHVYRSIKLGTLSAKLLRLLPPETAHNLAIWMLKKGGQNILPQPRVPQLNHALRTHVPKIGALPHPIGLAAGFDKNAECIDALAELNFATIEVGTITPLSQTGNAKPRIFRLSEQRALINRLGFNNKGMQEISQRLKTHPPKTKTPLGFNLGKNKLTANESAIDDYMKAFNVFSDLGQYFVINISSPNTPQLRKLAEPTFLKTLAHSIGPTKVESVWLKLDPDMSKQSLQRLTEATIEAGFAGLILANTHAVKWPHVGGMSGPPIVSKSLQLLEWCYEVHKGELPMISVGGINSGLEILQRLARGAAMVQIYTSFVYRGPWAVFGLLLELHHEMQLQGYKTLEDIRYSYYS